MIERIIRLNEQTLEHNETYSEVMFIGDVHYGSPQCDVKRFESNLEFCLNHHRYVFLMGDMIELATRDSVGAGVYEQGEIADDQHEKMVGYLKPLAEQGLILGSLQGNHEERAYKKVGFDVSRALARELGFPYLGNACWNIFKVGDERYSIYSLHGRTGARYDGTALLALERISTSFYADLIAMGHAHKCIDSILLMQRPIGARITEHKKFLLITGHYLNYDGGYGQTLGLPLTKKGSPKVRFYKNKHDITIHW